MNNQSSWTALCLPSGHTHKGKEGFKTEQDALEYIFSQMCDGCRLSRQRALDGTSDPDNENHQFDHIYPPCFFEWDVEEIHH